MTTLLEKVGRQMPPRSIEAARPITLVFVWGAGKYVDQFADHRSIRSIYIAKKRYSHISE